MILPQSATIKYSLLLFATIILLAFPADVFAEKVNTEEWQITADKIIRYDNPPSIVAEGNIQLIKREKLPTKPAVKVIMANKWPALLEEKPKIEQKTPKDLETTENVRYETRATIKADWMAYDVTFGTIKLRGHIDIVTGEENLVAEQGVVNLSRDTGTFTDATVTLKKNKLHLEGKTVEKTGVQTYHIVDGWIITCKVAHGETPPWSFSSNDTTITQGGYALMKNAKFNIKGVPVFYTPYMVLPAKDTRETGFLFPEISHSLNNGYGFNLPFFYNISESADVTIFSQYYLKRGFMPGAEFRYVRKTDDKGTFAVDYLNDNLSGPIDTRNPSEISYYNSTRFTHTNSDRYWLRGKIDTTFGNDWIARIDLDIVSDRDYLTEFSSSSYTGFNQNNSRFLDTFGRGFQDKTEDQRQNTVGILKSWTGISLVTNVLAINDVRTTKGSPTPLWQLPGIDFSGVTPIRDSKFNFSWDANYVDYWRQNGIGAQRFDLYPKVSTPIPLGPYFESRAEAGVRETFYGIHSYGDSTWSGGDSPNRTLYNFHTEIGTTLARDFNTQLYDFKLINHKMRPFIQYDYLPKTDQTSLPSFNSIDRIDPANTITYGINNFFDLFKDAKNRDFKSTSEFGYFKIKQSYYLDGVRRDILVDSNNNPLPADETDKPFSPIDMRFGWKLSRNLDIIYKNDLDVYNHGFIVHGLETSYKNSRGDILDLDYRNNTLQNIEQINFHVKTQLLSNVLGEFMISHSLSQSQTNEEDISLTYQAPCWSVQLRSTYTPTDQGVMLIFNLANIGASLPFSL
jgi:LPS-assembly protein